MYSVTETYLSKVNHYSRGIKTRVYFNDSETPMTTDLISVTVQEMGISGDSVSIGDLCTNKAEITFKMPSDKIPLQGGKVRIEHGVLVNEASVDTSKLGLAKLDFMILDNEGTFTDEDFEWIPMGTYFITEIEGKEIVKIVCYDSSTRLEKKYEPTITFPNTIKNVANDILTQCDLTMVNTTFPEITIETYEENCEAMICYIAGLMGKSVKINRNDKLEFYWWNDCGYVVDRSIQYLSGLTRKTDDDVVISSLTSGTEEEVITVGSGYGITFTNPYMTETLLNSIYGTVNGLTYTPCNVEYRGNPALEIGDIVTVIDGDGNERKALVSNHTLVLTGMKGTIESIGDTEENLVLSKSATDKKLEQLRTSMQTVMKNITEKITGIKGGYYHIDYDSEGFPCGWTIMNTPTLTNTTKLWKMTMGGFGFSKDGGQTFSNLAFDMDGNFYADAVNTGVLNGECFSLDLDKGTLLIGERDADGNISNPLLSYTLEDSLNVNGVIESTEGHIGGIDITENGLIKEVADGSRKMGFRLLPNGAIVSFNDTTSGNAVYQNAMLKDGQLEVTYQPTNDPTSGTKLITDTSRLALYSYNVETDSYIYQCGIGLNAIASKDENEITIDTQRLYVNGMVSTYDSIYCGGGLNVNKNPDGIIGGAGLEIFHSSTPYIDFHYGGTTGDYTSRIIESAKGKLDVNGVTFKDGTVTGNLTGKASGNSPLGCTTAGGGATLLWSGSEQAPSFTIDNTYKYFLVQVGSSGTSHAVWIFVPYCPSHIASYFRGFGGYETNNTDNGGRIYTIDGSISDNVVTIRSAMVRNTTALTTQTQMYIKKVVGVK